MVVLNHKLLYWTVWDRYMQVVYLDRAPRTKKTLPDFREKCRGHPTFTSVSAG